MTGQVDDSVFEELGFPMDRDPEGNRVRRDAGIQQELCQGAKILTIKHHTELRDIVKRLIELEKKRKPKIKKTSCVTKFLLMKYPGGGFLAWET